MPQILTIQDLDNLADLIARDGVTAHADSLGQLADAAARVDLLPGSTAILRDHNAAPLQKARAFQKLHRNWHHIAAATAAKTDFETAFAALAQQWQRHQMLRSTGDIQRLWESRMALDTRRALATTMARASACHDV